MVGRDEEISRLLDAADRARSGDPVLVLVTGEAGIGKSRLVRELTDRLDDALVLVGHGVDLSSGDLPFGPVADTLRDLRRKRGADALGAGEQRALAPLLPGVADDGTSDRARLMSGVIALVERLAADELVCWVVEDLHWADAATRDLVSILARGSGGRLLLVTTVRTDDPAVPAVRVAELTAYVDGLVRLPATEVVRVDRLGDDDVRRQLASLVDEPLPVDVARKIIDVGDGIPFVVEELAAARGRSGLSTVESVAGARLGSLSGSGRRLVEAAALGDGHLHHVLLETVLDLPAEELDEAVLDAISAGILEEDRGGDGFRFRHALLRDAADRSIPPVARRGWHRRWAQAIRDHAGLIATDPALLASAHHWAQADDPEEAAVAAAAATGAAARAGAARVELDLWARMLELWPRATESLEAMGLTRHDVLAEAIQVGYGALETGEYIARLDGWAATAQDEAETAAIELARLSLLPAKGDLPSMQALSTELRDEWLVALRSIAPDRLTIDAIAAIASFYAADDPVADALLEDMTAAAEELGYEHGLVNAWAIWSWRMAARGDPAGASDGLERFLRRPVAMSYGVWRLDGNLVYCLAIQGRHREALAAAERAMARVADPRSVGPAFEHIVENACYSWLRTGEWERVRELITTSRPFWGPGVTLGEVRLGELQLLTTGRLDDPEVFRHDLAHPTPGGSDAVSLCYLLAVHAAHQGDLTEMRRLLAEPWSHPDPVGFTDRLWPIVVSAIRVEADAAVRSPDPADRPAAEEHVATIEAIAARLQRWGGLGEAWSVEVDAQVARFRGEEALSLFEGAVAAWERIDHVHDAAVARVGLAEAQLAAGERDAARRTGQEAAAVARRLGAAPLAAQVEELLRLGRLASGPRGAEAAAGVLTARETEVLALLSEGRTNEQIAGELFMSPKTASVHVSRIIAKLGAANRTEAAAIARRANLV
nr:LuxR family transcriptional regulator [Nocardioides thalensis]